MSSERLPRTSPSHGLLDASASPSASRIAACHRHTPTEEGTVTLQSSKVSAFPWTVVLHHPRARRGKCPRSQRRTCPPTASTLTPLLSTLDRPVLTDLKSLSYSTEGGGLQPHQAPLSSAPGPLLELAFPNDEQASFHDMSREELRYLLIVCTQESHFQFDGKYYDQIDGVAMGSPLGPLFANAFMSNFENKHMEKLHELGVVTLWRFVDDVFATVGSEEQVQSIVDYLNKQHPNIKFTFEREANNRLPFLDTAVVRRLNDYGTNVYRKKTYTGVYTNWTSLTAGRYKIGLIRGQVGRIWRVVSDEEERMAEIEKFKYILAKNDFPSDIVNTTIRLFLEQKARQAEPKKEEKEVKRFLKLPYVSKECEGFAYKMKQLMNEHFPHVEFNVAFETPMTIGKMFPFKDKNKKVLDQVNVVYNLQCSCGDEYVGKCDRILYHRLNEHKNTKESAVKLHHDKHQADFNEKQEIVERVEKLTKAKRKMLTDKENEEYENAKKFVLHKVDYEGISILDGADTVIKLRVKELLHILKKNPELNKQLGKQSDFEIKTFIVKVYPQFRPVK